MNRNCCLAITALLAASIPALARPAHKQALADYFGPFLARKLNHCQTCHVPAKPGQAADGLEEEKPRNAFGTRLESVRSELKKAGKKTTIADRLQAIADEDADGDGAPNLIELLTGHAPGDGQDKPSAVEVAEVRKTLTEFVRFRNAYPWRPFEAVKRPQVPAVARAAWVHNPVDAFIAAEHAERGLTPRPEAAKPVLLRRVTLDLTGLPPTPAELHAFLADSSSDAYEKVVDRLLESPRHGERWGRHWMDVWRYSDWAGWSGGNQIRDSQPHVWRWRDWIVESLNADKGYDRMIVEMLAADELTPEDTGALRATGYLVRNFKSLSREKWMQDTVDHTFQAFLGVTIGCARCHDHMYDPIPQKEYYQIRAIFDPHHVRTDRVPGEYDTKKDGLVRAYDANPQVTTVLYVRGDERMPDKAPLPPGVPEALGGRFPKIEPIALPPSAVTPDRRAFVIDEELHRSAALVPKSRATLATARRDLSRALAQCLVPGALPAVCRLAAAEKLRGDLALAELDVLLAESQHAALVAAVRAERLEDAGRKESSEWKQAATAAASAHRQAALLAARRGLLVARQAVAVAAGAKRLEAAKKVSEAEKALIQTEVAAQMPATTTYTKRTVPIYPAMSTGRRLAFARWVADRDNPLTARVAMNHIWLRHFGRAIVPSVFDFGRNGRPPSHPALLDWLAAEFMESGWRMKAMHRLLVTSATYRMASTPDDANLSKDGDNRFLWRMPSRRLEAEAVRDCVFFVAGQLDATMGGSDIDQNLGLTLPRRSLYFRHAQEKQMEFLKIFDCASVTECYQRKESVLPQQALALANSELALRHARLLARELAAGHAGSAAFTVAAFERVLSRPPTPQELAECTAFLAQQALHHGAAKGTAPSGPTAGAVPVADPSQRARENLVHVLFNHNDFVTVR